MSQLCAVLLDETIASAEPAFPHVPVRARVAGIDPQGRVIVAHADLAWRCAVLDVLALTRPLEAGDLVVVLPPSVGEEAVVIGRIGPYIAEGETPAPIVICAPGGLCLQSGNGSVEVRPNGQIMIRGEDVLVRAKGTQRIRAGTVSIN